MIRFDHPQIESFGETVFKFLLLAAEKEVRFSFEVLKSGSFFFLQSLYSLHPGMKKTYICLVNKVNGTLSVNTYGYQALA